MRGSNGGKGYSVFGEHNKLTGTYTGTGTPNIIQVDGIGSLLFVYPESDTKDDADFALVTPYGVWTQDNGSTSFGEGYITFNDGKLGIPDASRINKEGVAYKYQVL